MSKSTDIRVVGARLYCIPIQMRIPLKFGPETVTSVTCARACVRLVDRQGRTAEGWGETPLSVQWVWPGKLAYEPRLETLKKLCVALAEAWAGFEVFGHPIEVGHEFQEQILPRLLQETNQIAVEPSIGGASVLAHRGFLGTPAAAPHLETDRASEPMP